MHTSTVRFYSLFVYLFSSTVMVHVFIWEGTVNKISVDGLIDMMAYVPEWKVIATKHWKMDHKLLVFLSFFDRLCEYNLL